MLKRLIMVVLCFTLLCPIFAYADEPRYVATQPALDFSGTTASCSFSFTKFGKHIEVTMELWCGNTLVDTWTKEGNHTVTIDETCSVVRGRTYTLKVTGVCGTETITSTPVTKTCP